MNKNPLEILNQVELEAESAPKKTKLRVTIPLTNPKLAVEKGSSKQTPRFDPKKVLVFHLEDGFPSVDEARRILRLEFDTQRRRGVKLIKVIHGYGSSGKGGALAKAMPELLKELVNSGAIESFVLGEKFSCFNTQATQLLAKYSLLKKDQDYGNNNTGMSIVEL